MDIIYKDNSKMLFSKILYISRLEVNLLSEKRVCEAGLLEEFDSYHIYFKKDNKKIIRTRIQNGIYIVSYITKGYKGKGEIPIIASKIQPFRTRQDQEPIQSD